MKFSQQFFLSAGDCNAEGELSLPVLTSKLIDIATAHANQLGIGNPDMPDDHSGWVLSRLTIEMTAYPVMDTEYSISTWVEGWNRHFSERVFCIKKSDGEIVGWARSIWMVLDTENRSNAGLDRLNFPSEWIMAKECPIARQGKHRQIVAMDAEADSSMILRATSPVERYRFGYADLDAYRHVNTVRYFNLLINQLSLHQHDEYMIHRLELSFLHEGEYGKEIDILHHYAGDGESAFLLQRTEDKKDVLYSRIFLKKR